MDMKFNYVLNEERIFDRLEELQEYLENFPESKLTHAVENEIKYLQSLL